MVPLCSMGEKYPTVSFVVACSWARKRTAMRRLANTDRRKRHDNFGIEITRARRGDPTLYTSRPSRITAHSGDEGYVFEFLSCFGSTRKNKVGGSPVLGL